MPAGGRARQHFLLLLTVDTGCSETEGTRGHEEGGEWGWGGMKPLSGACGGGSGGRMDPLGVNADAQGHPSPAPALESDDPSPAQVRWGTCSVCYMGRSRAAVCVRAHETLRPDSEGSGQDRIPHRAAVARELTCIVEVWPGPTFLLQLQKWR